MHTATELLAAALQHHQAGRLQEAELLYRDVVAIEPANVDAWHLLGIVCQQIGKRQDAQSCLRSVVRLQPALAEAHFNLGQVLRSDGKLDDAIECFGRAVAIDSEFVEAKHSLAAALNDQAVKCRERGNLHEEIENYRRAIKVNANIAEIHFNLGIATRDLRLDDAIASFRRALELDPNLANANAALGLALYKHNEIDEAICKLRTALQQDATDAATYNNLGLALRLKGEMAEAVECFRRAVELDLDRADVHSNLGLALHDLGELDEAVTCYRRAIARDKDLTDAHVGISTLLLLKGDFGAGWSEYEWRWKKTDQFAIRAFPQPRWSGESLAGKTILIYAEQGLGDTIQFVRYLSVLKQQGAKIVFECQKALVKLLASYPGIDHLVAEGSELPGFDIHSPLLSVPRVLKMSLATIPADVPYLFADPGLVARWRGQLQDLRGFKIGINWHGRAGHLQAERRDIPIHYFASLAALPGVRVLSLQKDGGQELSATAEKPFVDLGDRVDVEHGPFMDTAAIMMNLDLVITSDTSIAHLAGALAVPVWVALPSVPDWRWLLERGDSPWYPTMRVFRQQKSGDWESVFKKIRAALVERIPNADRRFQK